MPVKRGKGRNVNAPVLLEVLLVVILGHPELGGGLDQGRDGDVPASTSFALLASAASFCASEP